MVKMVDNVTDMALLWPKQPHINKIATYMVKMVDNVTDMALLWPRQLHINRISKTNTFMVNMATYDQINGN
jgi:hypothetical protein